MKTMKKLFTLFALFILANFSFAQSSSYTTPADIKAVWEGRVMPSVTNIDSTFGAYLSKSENATYVVTASDTTTSATLTNIPSFVSNTLTAGATYEFDADFLVTASSTGGYKVGTGGTATATFILYEVQIFNNATDTIITQGKVASQGSSHATGSVAYTDAYIHIHGTIKVSVAGTFSFTYAQNSASGNFILLKGSTAHFRKIY